MLTAQGTPPQDIIKSIHSCHDSGERDGVLSS